MQMYCYACMHDEADCYVYGYQAADGCFQVRTRHRDGFVPGRFRSVDTVQIRVIVNTADLMDFLPLAKQESGHLCENKSVDVRRDAKPPPPRRPRTLCLCSRAKNWFLAYVIVQVNSELVLVLLEKMQVAWGSHPFRSSNDVSGPR